MEIYKRLFNDDGSFKPSVEKKPKKVSIQYLDELCEWLYYRDDISDDEKLEQILAIENIIRRLLDNYNGMHIGFIPTWSIKFNK